MIKEITIENCRSILKATIPLSPFTLLIGANGTGKSNFLRLLQHTSFILKNNEISILSKHINYSESVQRVIFKDTNDSFMIQSVQNNFYFNGTPIQRKSFEFDRYPLFSHLINISVFSLNPENAGKEESLTTNPVVREDGSGVVQVIDSLKTGDREDLFEKIQSTLNEFIPEIEKISFIPKENAKQLQVREKHISLPVPVSQLSDGTKLVLIILTILFQEKPPSIICIEEIDRGLHPRLFGKIVDLCFQMAKQENMPQIIATTHNPYLVDQFKGNEQAVIIVEKKEGQTIFTTLKERLSQLEADEEPLGELWYSGFVGGVPTLR